MRIHAILIEVIIGLSAKDIMTGLAMMCARAGGFKRLITDNQPAFKLLRQWFLKEKVPEDFMDINLTELIGDWKLTIPYDHESNGTAERFVRLVKDTWRPITDDM